MHCASIFFTQKVFSFIPRHSKNRYYDLPKHFFDKICKAHVKLVLQYVVKVWRCHCLWPGSVTIIIINMKAILVGTVGGHGAFLARILRASETMVPIAILLLKA